MVGSQPINRSDKSSSLVLCTNLERPTMSDNMTINRLRFGFHRSDNRFQNSVPVLALFFSLNYPPRRWNISESILHDPIYQYQLSPVTVNIHQPRWLSGMRRSRVHSLMIARRSLCPEKLGSNPGQGSKGINFSGWHGLDMSITVTKRR